MDFDDELTVAVKSLALEGGFARVGIAPATAVPHGEIFRDWLARGYHASMAYMARNVEKRLRPELLAEAGRSVICLAVSYAPPQTERAAGPIARYARGRDYHKVLKKRCVALMGRLRRIAPNFEGRAFVDSAPVAERSLAAMAGVGFIGRNGCLIVPGLGSYVVLCEIVCNLPLRPTEAIASQCGDCGACLAACPTGAFADEGVVDARRCISYLTIEHAGEIPAELLPRIGDRVFGCDACQAACPHNRDVPPGDAELTTQAGGGGKSLPTPEEILRWSHTDWDAATRGRAIRRAGYEMLLRNAVIAAGNAADPALVGPLERLSAAQPQLAEALRWALARCGDADATGGVSN